MASNTGKSWLEDPRQLDNVIESVKGEGTSDRYLSRFYAQLRYARPMNVAPTTGLTNAAPAFLDGFLSVVKQIGYNQFMEVTDACTAKICQPLRPKVKPTAAKPDIARMCTLLNRLQDGVLDTCDFLAEATQAWEDIYCFTLGTVLFEIEPSIREISCHRTDPILNYWSRHEGRNPIHFYMQEAVSRDVLLERYPHAKNEIERAPQWTPEHMLGVDPPSSGNPDTVCINRGWRRKIGDEAGRHVVTVNKAVLNGGGEGEEWPYDFFPLAFFRGRWDHHGFGGVPLGRYIAPHHMAINRLARIAEDSFKGAVPLLMSHKDSKKGEMNDVPYQVFKWEGAIPPQVVPTNPVSEQVLRRIDYHDAKAYAIAGVNKALGAGQKPAGINSGVALREFIDLADARMNEYQKHWEAAWRQAGHIIVAFANELKKVRVRSASDANAELMEEIDVRAIKLDRNDYRISYGLTSALSKSVTGLLADLQDFKDLGFVDQVDMAEAIGDKVPDLQSVMDRVTAARRLAAKMVQTALEKGEIPTPPSAMQGQQGLDAIVLLGQQAWSQAMINPERYTPENLEALRRLMKLAQAKKGAPLPAMPTVQPGAPIPQNAIMPIGTPAALPPMPPAGPGAEMAPQ
jgi:hypothetical protein